MTAEIFSLISEFDIFAPRPVLSSVVETTVVIYKPNACVVQSDVEFLIHADNVTYVHVNIKLYTRQTDQGGRDKFRQHRFQGSYE